MLYNQDTVCCIDTPLFVIQREHIFCEAKVFLGSWPTAGLTNMHLSVTGIISVTQFNKHHIIVFVYVFLTVHHSIDLFPFTNFTVQYSTVCQMRADSADSALIRRTVQTFTESDDIRCCDNTFCPPEDGHIDDRNMWRIVM